MNALAGRPRGPRPKTEVDPTLRDHFVYRIYDEDNNLLYVGCSKNLDQRWKCHLSDKWSAYRWAPFAHHFRVAGPYTRSKAFKLEKNAIWHEGSIFNGGEANNHTSRVRVDRLVKQAQAQSPGEDSRAVAERVRRANPTRADLYLIQRDVNLYLTEVAA